MSEIPSVYFLGSGSLGLPILDRLLASRKLRMIGFGTQTDRKSGRGQKESPTPVAAKLQSVGIFPDKELSINSPPFLERLKALSPDFILTASFGQMLKSEILSLPRIACVNVHASILPLYRGASPIQSAILNGDSRSGVAFMKMDKGLDTGPVYQIYEVEICGSWRAPDLENALGELAALNVEDCLEGIASGAISPLPQDNAKATYAGKIEKEMGQIDWNGSAEAICRKLRAFHPWPGVFFEIEIDGRSERVKLLDASPLSGCAENLNPGTIIPNREDPAISCGNGTALLLKKLLPQGRREMSGADFIRGLRSKTFEIVNRSTIKQEKK